VILNYLFYLGLGLLAIAAITVIIIGMAAIWDYNRSKAQIARHRRDHPPLSEQARIPLTDARERAWRS
jgi:hypothetical protein